MKNIFFVVFAFVLIGIFASTSALHKENPDLNIYNFTNDLNWNSTFEQRLVKEINTSLDIDFASINNMRIKNMIYKTIDWVGYLLFESAKYAIELGFNYASDELIVTDWIVWLARIVVFCVAFPIIVPLIALIYILIELIIKGYKYVRLKQYKKNG